MKSHKDTKNLNMQVYVGQTAWSLRQG